MTLTVALTGANGYVGSCIAESLERQGMKVVRFQRTGDGPNVRLFALGAPIAPNQFDGIDALIHCAYDFSATRWEDIVRLNIDASLALFATARDAGVERLLFISSMSAFDGCQSMYGHAKLQVEHQGRSIGVQSIRPGLVYGQREGGMVGALIKLLGLPVFTPLVGMGNQQLYLAHEEDLGAMLGAMIAEGRNERGSGGQNSLRPIIAANAQALSFREILTVLAHRLHGRQPRFLPVPWQLEWLALKAAERMGLRVRLRSDSLISLINQDPAPDFSRSREYAFRAFV